MNLKLAILAVLAERPSYGYQVRAELMTRTDQLWQINPGQIYSTLERATRDALVTAAGHDEAGRTLYQVTELGREQMCNWFNTFSPDSDERHLKVCLALSLPSVSGGEVLDRTIAGISEQISRLSNQADSEHPYRELKIQRTTADRELLLMLSEKLHNARHDPYSTPLAEHTPQRGRPKRHRETGAQL